MAEQMTAPSDEGQQPETGAGPQLFGQPMQTDNVASGVAGLVHLDGSLEQLPASPSSGKGLAADGTGQGTGPTHSRRRKVIAAAAAAVLVMTGGIALGLALSRGGQSFPSTLLGLARDDSADAQQVTGQITAKLGVLQGLIVHPGAAIYGSPNDGVLILTGQWSNAAKADGFISNRSVSAIDGLRSVGVTDAALYPVGSRGGSLACGNKTVGGQSGVVCAWADAKMFAVTIYFGSASSLSDAAAKTIRVRSAVEQ